MKPLSTVRPSAAGRPRVLQVVLSLRPGGTEKLVVELVARLRGQVDMTVCCLDEAGTWADQLHAAGVDVAVLNRRQGFRPALGRAIADVAARHQATILHCHQYSPFVYGALARVWRPALRVMFTEHGRLSDAPPSLKRRLANSVLSRVPERVFTVSAELRDHLAGEGFDRANVDVIYNGIDVGTPPDASMRSRVRSELALPEGSVVIGTVARLDPVKDLGTLIHAVSLRRREHPMTLLVVGDGPERQRLESLTTTLDAASFVRFAGHRDDARRLLSACDVYANSSISEGISLTILEAMAAELPVVATNVGGTPEIVGASYGRLVACRNPEELSAALVALALDPAARRSMGRAGRARVEEQFTLDQMVGAYRDAYDGKAAPPQHRMRGSAAATL